jgi:uncharacterized protein DUF5753
VPVRRISTVRVGVAPARRVAHGPLLAAAGSAAAWWESTDREQGVAHLVAQLAEWSTTDGAGAGVVEEWLRRPASTAPTRRWVSIRARATTCSSEPRWAPVSSMARCRMLTENGLHQRMGGPKVMARQLRHLADLASRDNVSVRVIPGSQPAHAGLTGAFVLLDFANDPSVVHVEARTTGLFRDQEDEVALYQLTVEKLTDAALDEPASIKLMRSIARDLDGE